MLVFMFVMMRVFVRVAFVYRIAAIQILAVFMVLRIQLQGNMGDAFGLHQTLYRLRHALRLANCHRAIQNQMSGKQMAIAGERPQMQIVHAQHLRHGADFVRQRSLVYMLGRALHQNMQGVFQHAQPAVCNQQRHQQAHNRVGEFPAKRHQQQRRHNRAQRAEQIAENV